MDGPYHSFLGGCYGNGDYVDDSLVEKSAAYGCSSGRDSYKRNTGAEPVYYLMDDTEDPYMDEFNSGQVSHMASSWSV